MKIDPAKLGGERRAPQESYLTAMRDYVSAKPEDSQSVPIAQLTPYPDQPFRPYTPEKLAELAEDIAAHGVISPIFLRPLCDGGYQILSGHNRVAAAKLAGLTEIPAVIHEIDDDTATKIMVNSNLLQRQELLPSEKAFAYKMRLDVMKRQAGRPSSNSAQVALNYEGKQSRDILAEQSGESKDQIRRYIRLTYLSKELLDKVDDGSVPFVAGVELSYLPTAWQTELVAVLEEHRIKRVTNRQAGELRTAAQEDGDAMREEITRVLGLTNQRSTPVCAIKFSVEIPLERSKQLTGDAELRRRVQEVVDAYLKERGLTDNGFSN